MPDVLELIGGSEVACNDGPCGTLGRLIVDPTELSVTHLSVEPKGFLGNGRLVPIAMVRSVEGAIQLNCSTSEFEALETNEAMHAVGFPMGGFTLLTLHHVPDGELEVNGEENILGTDGKAGHLRGLGVDAGDFRITELLLVVGHLTGKRNVAVPIELITSIDEEGVHLSVSKSQVSSF